MNAKLKKEAENQKVSVNDIRKQYIFTLFLKRIFSLDDDNWLLLGGNALLIRTGAGSYTQDIDLARKEPFDSADEIHQELQDLTSRVTPEDHFRFRIERVRMHQDRIDDYGYGTQAAKAAVTAYLGAQEFEKFTVDVVQQRHVQAPVDRLPLRAIIDHATLQNLPEVLVVPLENHLADKICAMYERHRGGASTRMRDLADIVRIVQ